MSLLLRGALKIDICDEYPDLSWAEREADKEMLKF